VGFSGGNCDCNYFAFIQGFKYFLCRTYVLLVFASSCVGVHVFYHIEQLFIVHMINMAAAIKTGIKYKLLSSQGRLDILDTMYGTKDFPHEKDYLRTLHRFTITCKLYVLTYCRPGIENIPYIS
jgi:hypothetical protein